MALLIEFHLTLTFKQAVKLHCNKILINWLRNDKEEGKNI